MPTDVSNLKTRELRTFCSDLVSVEHEIDEICPRVAGSIQTTCTSTWVVPSDVDGGGEAFLQQFRQPRWDRWRAVPVCSGSQARTAMPPTVGAGDEDQDETSREPSERGDEVIEGPVDSPPTNEHPWVDDPADGLGLADVILSIGTARTRDFFERITELVAGGCSLHDAVDWTVVAKAERYTVAQWAAITDVTEDAVHSTTIRPERRCLPRTTVRQVF